MRSSHGPKNRFFYLIGIVSLILLALLSARIGIAYAETGSMQPKWSGNLPKVADGEYLELQNGFMIAPPAKWDLRWQSSGLTMVAEEPKKAVRSVKVEGLKNRVKYRRNITLATVHTGSPMDLARLERFQAELVERFSKRTGVKDFSILDAQTLPGESEDDPLRGLIVYTGLRIGEFPLMQLHVLMSDAEAQYVMTYTDLAERFSEQGPVFQAAWATLAGGVTASPAPERVHPLSVQQIAIYVGLGVLGLWLFFTAMRWLAKKALNRSSSRRGSRSSSDVSDMEVSDVPGLSHVSMMSGVSLASVVSAPLEESGVSEAPSAVRVNQRLRESAVLRKTQASVPPVSAFSPRPPVPPRVAANAIPAPVTKAGPAPLAPAASTQHDLPAKLFEGVARESALPEREVRRVGFGFDAGNTDALSEPVSEYYSEVSEMLISAHRVKPNALENAGREDSEVSAIDIDDFGPSGQWRGV